MRTDCDWHYLAVIVVRMVADDVAWEAGSGFCLTEAGQASGARRHWQETPKMAQCLSFANVGMNHAIGLAGLYVKAVGSLRESAP